MANDFPTRGPWFVEFMREKRLKMGIIRKQYFDILALTVAALHNNWYVEW